MSSYLLANRIGRWVYERRELSFQPQAPKSLYVRQITARRLSEGVLGQREFLPLEDYLQPIDAPTSQPATEDRPAAPLEKRAGAFFKLAEPMEPIPDNIEMTSPITSTTTIYYFDHLGQLQTTGTLTREVQIEGYENVDRYERCLRVRVNFEAYFPWMLIIDWTSYLWLSPQVGEVRRIQRLSGCWFWIFWFASAHEYRLISHDTITSYIGSGPPPKWEYGAILFDRGIPRPRISGMIVDFPKSAPAE